MRFVERIILVYVFFLVAWQGLSKSWNPGPK